MDSVKDAPWRKSNYSGSSGSNCVEAGVGGAGRVLVRDTADRDGAMLNFSAGA